MSYFSEESKPDSDLDEPWIMTVKGLHNFHNNMKAMEESVMQNGNNNLLYKGINRDQQQQNQPKSPSSPNAPTTLTSTTTTTIESSGFTRKQQQESKHIETIMAQEINPGLVQLREKAQAAAAAFERHDRERELLRSNSQEEQQRRASKEVENLSKFLISVVVDLNVIIIIIFSNLYHFPTSSAEQLGSQIECHCGWAAGPTEAAVAGEAE